MNEEQPNGNPMMKSLLIWGDVVHLPGIQFALPQAGLAFDTDSLKVPYVELRIDAALPLECQRSLQRFLQPMQMVQRLTQPGQVTTPKPNAQPGRTQF